jgi:hypothetical protein
MSIGIDLRGKEQVLQQFDFIETPFYAVYQGKDLKFQHLEDDTESGRALLAQNLEILDLNGSTAPFKIVYYYGVNEKGKLSTDNVKGSNTFRIVSPGTSTNSEFYGAPELQNRSFPSRVAGVSNEYVEELKTQNQLLKQQLEAYEAEDTEPEAPTGINAMVSGLLSNPEIQSVVISRLCGLLDKILPQAPAVGQNAMLAGVQDNQIIIDNVNRLFAAGMELEDLQKLVTIAQSNPVFFKTLLTSLKSM